MATINVKDAAGSTVALEKPLAAGQALMAASRPVVIASDQSAVPVSAASLPLPAGAATAAKQPALGTAGTASADIISVQGIASMTPLLATATLNAETTKVIGVTRSADGSGNLLTSTGNALDINIKTGVNANGQAAMASSAPVAIASNQTWPTGMSPRGFSAAFTTLTRPANTTAYTALDSISDNATAGSVTALSASISDTNDDPVTLTEILVTSTDTGLAGKRIRAYLFNSDPTASTGVGGGDNAAYSQKKAGYIGSMSGIMETGFSDGTVGRLVPTFADNAAASVGQAAAGGFIVTKPTSGAKTLFIQYQAIDAFTPSANSTTIIGTARGFQGRAS